MKEIESATITFNDGKKAEIVFRENRILNITLSTGKAAVFIRKNKKGISAEIYEGILSKNEKEELEKIEELLK